MISDSPHLYRQQGTAAAVSEDVIENSLTQALIPESRGLPAVLTLKHLAVQTNLSFDFLRAIVERAIDPYFDIIIKRSDGRKMRPISAPVPGLKTGQQWILRRILSRLPIHPSSYAYSYGKSIKACARKHLGATWIVKLDVRNFFETIDESRVYSVFLEAGYQPLPAFELARICTRYAPHAHHIDRERFRSSGDYATISPYHKRYRGFLPQGAPTSGALANLVAGDLDRELAKLANDAGAVYTRYADDMAFSSASQFNRSKAIDLVENCRAALGRQGFELQDKKTRIQPPGARKMVLGLLVDGEIVRLNTRIRSRIEHHVRGVDKFGLAPHYTQTNFSSIDGFVNHVRGLLEFWMDIDPGRANAIRERWIDALHRDGWTSLNYSLDATEE